MPSITDYIAQEVFQRYPDKRFTNKAEMGQFLQRLDPRLQVEIVNAANNRGKIGVNQVGIEDFTPQNIQPMRGSMLPSLVYGDNPTTGQFATPIAEPDVAPPPTIGQILSGPVDKIKETIGGIGSRVSSVAGAFNPNIPLPEGAIAQTPATQGASGDPRELVMQNAQQQVAQGAAATAQDKAMGQMIFGTGLNMLAEASMSSSYKGSLGGLGTTIAGMAQMAGKGGKWALPVAALSSLVFLSGERESAKAQISAQKKLTRNFGAALNAAGSIYGK